MSDWIEHHPGIAAWVQAFGATLAVGTAVLVPTLQARHARQEREADRRVRAKSLAIAVYPELLHIRIAHRHILHQLQDQIGHPPGDAGPRQESVAGEAGLHLIPISDALRAMVSEFYLLGEPIGPLVQKCIGHSMKYNDVTNNMRGLHITVPVPQLLNFIAHGLQELDACITSIEQAWGIDGTDVRAFEDYFARSLEHVPTADHETMSKETV